MSEDIVSRGPSTRQWCLIIFLIGTCLYIPTVTYDFTFDDKSFVQQSDFIKHPSLFPYLWTRSYRGDVAGESLGHIRPVTMATFAVTWWAFGDNPMPFHATNALIHGFNALMLFLLVRRGFGSDRIAICTAVAFAVHPLQVEATANIVGRAELLVVMFGLLAWWVHMGGRPTAKRASLAGFLWLLALLSKASALPLIGMFAAGDWLLEGGARRANPKEWWRGRAMLFGAHAIALIIYFAMRWLVLGEIGSPAMDRQPHNPLSVLGLAERLPTAIAVLGLHWKLFAWPFPLRPDYAFNTFPLVESLGDLRFLAGLGVIAVTTALLVWGIRKHRILAMGVLIWAMGAAMTSNIVFAIGHLFAERNLYLPSIGMCLLVGVACAALWKRWRWGAWLLAVVALALAARTLDAERAWANDEALFRRASETTPNSTQVWTNRAALALRGALHPDTAGAEEAALLSEAEAHALRAIEIWPSNFEAQYHLASVALMRNDGEEAKRWLDAVLELCPVHSGAITTRCNVALIERDGETIDRVINRAIEVDPDHRIAQTLRIKTLLADGEIEEALEIAERLVAIYPYAAIQWRALTEARTAAGDRDGAMAAGVQYRRLQNLLGPSSNE